MRICLWLTCLLLIAACGEGSVRVPSGKPSKGNAPANNTEQPEPPADDPLVEQMRQHIKKVAARPERRADEIEVQHLLIGTSDGLPGKAIRSTAEAERFAAELFNQIQAGADFDALVLEHTDDSHPGKYTMTQVGPGDRRTLWARSDMVAAFGNVGWRLDVGEVGVAPYHPDTSKFGWHIIKRLR